MKSKKKVVEMFINAGWQKIFVTPIPNTPNRCYVKFANNKMNKIYFDHGYGIFAMDEMVTRNIKR
ncbi:MAG: hypothetical protein LBF36_00070 [Mycoplasmataceae bacterium]|jgi:hypothetical protein|nr:hypothetical protein [Mycoplasmataceae bacterium]